MDNISTVEMGGRASQVKGVVRAVAARRTQLRTDKLFGLVWQFSVSEYDKKHQLARLYLLTLSN